MSKIDDLESDLRHLYHLLDTLCDEQFTKTNRERCEALLWIARDCAKVSSERASLLTEECHG